MFMNKYFQGFMSVSFIFLLSYPVIVQSSCPVHFLLNEKRDEITLYSDKESESKYVYALVTEEKITELNLDQRSKKSASYSILNNFDSSSSSQYIYVFLSTKHEPLLHPFSVSFSRPIRSRRVRSLTVEDRAISKMRTTEIRLYSKSADYVPYRKKACYSRI